MPDRVYAAVERMEASHLDPPMDRVAGQADPEQLLATDHSVLSLRDCRDRGIPRVRFTFAAYGAVEVKLA